MKDDFFDGLMIGFCIGMLTVMIILSIAVNL